MIYSSQNILEKGNLKKNGRQMNLCNQKNDTFSLFLFDYPKLILDAMLELI